mmetsp:Transcript_8624/g.19676  ORF Transcript_8624/g.19676 Transcript_8624/m.19676 type:complete len:486 (-) Transcript_8624:62-1519(-)
MHTVDGILLSTATAASSAGTASVRSAATLLAQVRSMEERLMGIIQDGGQGSGRQVRVVCGALQQEISEVSDHIEALDAAPADSLARRQAMAVRVESKFDMEALSYRRKTLAVQRDIWSEFDNKKSPDFLNQILLARDGGFSEVGGLWKTTRWLSAFMVVLCILSNLAVIVVNDLLVIVSPEQVADGFLLTRGLVDLVFGVLRRLLGLPGHVDLTGAAPVCILELFVLTLLVTSGVWNAIRAATTREERARWMAVQAIFWKTLPELKSFSAMRLLHFATPSVVVADIVKFFAYSQSRWYGRCRCFLLFRKWAKLAATRSLCFMIGMDCFLTRTRHISARYFSEKHVSLWVVLNVGMFLMQILGIVQLEMLVRGRLFTFIFGGEDGILQPREKALKAVWNAMLARAIWQAYSFPRFCAVMMSFSDFDLQRLVLNERGQHTSSSPCLTPRPEEASSGSSSVSSDASDEEPADGATSEDVSAWLGGWFG